eukprot:COSAG01_NODE_4551_length_4930_cov_75.171807_5_plen_69_part_00
MVGAAGTTAALVQGGAAAGDKIVCAGARRPLGKGDSATHSHIDLRPQGSSVQSANAVRRHSASCAELR